VSGRRGCTERAKKLAKRKQKKRKATDELKQAQEAWRVAHKKPLTNWMKFEHSEQATLCHPEDVCCICLECEADVLLQHGNTGHTCICFLCYTGNKSPDRCPICMQMIESCFVKHPPMLGY